jgi:hypothetical protein
MKADHRQEFSDKNSQHKIKQTDGIFYIKFQEKINNIIIKTLLVNTTKVMESTSL